MDLISEAQVFLPLCMQYFIVTNMDDVVPENTSSYIMFMFMCSVVSDLPVWADDRFKYTTVYKQIGK